MGSVARAAADDDDEEACASVDAVGAGDGGIETAAESDGACDAGGPEAAGPLGVIGTKIVALGRRQKRGSGIEEMDQRTDMT